VESAEKVSSMPRYGKRKLETFPRSNKKIACGKAVNEL
jgi:hypothetical protein